MRGADSGERLNTVHHFFVRALLNGSKYSTSMHHWPKAPTGNPAKNLRRAVRKAGRLELPAADLAARFGVRRLTENSRARIHLDLTEAGVVVNPPIVAADRSDVVVLELRPAGVPRQVGEPVGNTGPSHRRLSSLLNTKALLVASALAVLLALVSGLLPDSPKRVPISASLTHAGKVSFTFAKGAHETTSPACGCARMKPPGGWRGIVMPAQELRVVTSKQTERISYRIFAPNQSQWNVDPFQYGSVVHETVVAVPAGVTPSREQLARVDAEPNFEVISQDDYKADWVDLPTAGPLNVTSSAVEPVAAFSPPLGNKTTIDYVRPSRNPSDPTLSISTPLRATDASDRKSNTVPILDVLGPSVTIWARLNDGDGVSPGYWKQPVPPQDDSLVGSDLAHTAESFKRMFALGAGSDFDLYVVLRLPGPMFATRIVAGQPMVTGATPATQPDGNMTVEVPNVGSAADALVRSFAKADAEPTIGVEKLLKIPTSDIATTRSVGTEAGQAEYHVAEEPQGFEFPPTPPVSGINVFGAVRELQFERARGSLTIGKTPQPDLKALTPLDMRDIEGEGVLDRHMIIPVRVDSDSAEIDVIGKAEVLVNGEPVAVDKHWVVEAIAPDRIAWIATVAAALLFASAQANTRRRPLANK